MSSGKGHGISLSTNRIGFKALAKIEKPSIMAHPNQGTHAFRRKRVWRPLSEDFFILTFLPLQIKIIWMIPKPIESFKVLRSGHNYAALFQHAV